MRGIPDITIVGEDGRRLVIDAMISLEKLETNGEIGLYCWVHTIVIQEFVRLEEEWTHCCQSGSHCARQNQCWHQRWFRNSLCAIKVKETSNVTNREIPLEVTIWLMGIILIHAILLLPTYHGDHFDRRYC